MCRLDFNYCNHGMSFMPMIGCVLVTNVFTVNDILGKETMMALLHSYL